jgi:hypothetical protein
MGKVCNQTGTYENHYASLGIDGLLSTSGTENCAVPKNEPPGVAEWWVDFGSLHRIYNVTLYFRIDFACKEEYAHFEVRLLMMYSLYP